MTVCAAKAENVESIAAQKLDKVPIEMVKDHYAGTPMAVEATALVDKIYADSFTDSWPYARSYFEQCAQAQAGVGAKRVGTAAYCFLSMLIAETAWQYRNSGEKRAEAYRRFAGFEGDAPKQIVDSIYDPAELPPQGVEMDTWDACMTQATLR